MSLPKIIDMTSMPLLNKFLKYELWVIDKIRSVALIGDQWLCECNDYLVE